jgi:hypothetical protein
MSADNNHVSTGEKIMMTVFLLVSWGTFAYGFVILCTCVSGIYCTSHAQLFLKVISEFFGVK